MLIASACSGKRVEVVSAYKDAFTKLKQAADAGTYWARVAVLGLESVNTGMLGKDNVFVKPNERVVQGAEMYVMSLPGITATIERRANDPKIVAKLALDDTYFSNFGSKQTPGLYRARKGERKWATELIPEGNMTNGEHAPNGSAGSQYCVAVADASHKDASDAAVDVSALVAKVPVGQCLNSSTCISAAHVENSAAL